MRCMHPSPLSLTPVPEPKALEPESQEPECTPLPRTPLVLSQRHNGQSLQSTTPSTLSARCLWMSWRPQEHAMHAFPPSLSLPPVPERLNLTTKYQVPSTKSYLFANSNGHLRLSMACSSTSTTLTPVVNESGALPLAPPKIQTIDDPARY